MKCKVGQTENGWICLIFLIFFNVLYEEAATGCAFWKTVILKISQILQENNCVGMSYFQYAPDLRSLCDSGVFRLIPWNF